MRPTLPLRSVLCRSCRVVVESGFACKVSGIPAALYAWTRYRLFNLCLDTPSYPPSIFKNRVELHPCADLTVPPFHALVRFCEAMHRYCVAAFPPFRLRMVDPKRSLNLFCRAAGSLRTSGAWRLSTAQPAKASLAFSCAAGC